MVYLASIRGKTKIEDRTCVPPAKKMSQLTSGLRTAALIIVGFVVAVMFFGGAGSLFPPSVRSRWLGALFLVISTPIMIMTANRWLKIMSGLLGLAVLNGILSLATGHVLANPTMPISRIDALYLTLFFAVAAILTGTMKQRTLRLVDRISVMAFLLNLAFLISYQAQQEAARKPVFNAAAFTLIAISISCLSVAWAAHYVQHRRVGARVGKI